MAYLAGIGTTWYTFLEQGRNVRVSSKVLDRLSGVFGLNHAERRYLYQLALGTLPDDEFDASELITDDLKRLLKTVDPWPAYVLDHRFDMIAWNTAGSLVFDYSDVTPETNRNVIRRLVLDPGKRQLHRDYEAHVRNTLAAFRPHFSRHADDLSMRALVRELEAASGDFRRWWSQHEVLDSARLQITIHLDHPTLGELAGRFVFLAVFGHPNLTLCIFTPDPSGKTEAAIARALQNGP